MGLRARDRGGTLEELGDAGKVDVAAAKDHHDAIPRGNRNATKEERRKCGSTRGFDDLLRALHREVQAAEDLLVGEGDDPVEERRGERERPAPCVRRTKAVGDRFRSSRVAKVAAKAATVVARATQTYRWCA